MLRSKMIYLYQKPAIEQLIVLLNVVDLRSAAVVSRPLLAVISREKPLVHALMMADNRLSQILKKLDFLSCLLCDDK
jgi:hypothetical protein